MEREGSVMAQTLGALCLDKYGCLTKLYLNGPLPLSVGKKAITVFTFDLCS